MLIATLAWAVGAFAPDDFPSFKAFEDADNIHIEIVSQDFVQDALGYQIKGAAVTPEQLEKYRPLFLHEWSLYPPGLLAKARVTKIVICTGLSLDGQFRAAVPSFDLNAMYYDATLGAPSPHFQRNVIHHEFYHMLDSRMGKIYRDAEWSALNPPDFRYGNGGRNMRTAGVGELTDTIPAFLTKYGTAAVEEDKAELFSHMVVDPIYVQDRAKVDTFLPPKMALLRDRLTKYMPEMGDPFWVKQGWPAATLGLVGGTRLGIAELLALGRRRAVPAW